MVAKWWQNYQKNIKKYELILKCGNYKTSVFRVNTQYGILYPTELKVWSERVQNSVDTLLIDKKYLQEIWRRETY